MSKKTKKDPEPAKSSVIDPKPTKSSSEGSPFAMTYEEEVSDDFINKLAKEVVDRHLTAPAIVLLETGKPLSFTASQVMVFFRPIIESFISIQDYPGYIQMFENRNNLERLILAIERIEDEKIREKKVSKNGKNEKGRN